MIRSWFLLTIILILSTIIGEEWVSPRDPLFYELVVMGRWPQVLAAFSVGSLLSLCGLIFQQLFANPLATPFTLGVSSWSSFGACVGIVLGHAYGNLIWSLIFTLIGLLFLLAFSRLHAVYLLLAGVGLQMLASSGILFFQYFSYQSDLEQMVKWLVGSVSFWGPEMPLLLLSLSVAGYFILGKYKHELFALTVGEDWAKSKGIPVEKMRRYYLLLVSLFVGVTVSFVGPIGFIGLVIPHLATTKFSNNFSRVWFASWFWGGLALSSCLILSKLLSVKGIFPVGVVVTLIGTPYYLWMLKKQANQ